MPSNAPATTRRPRFHTGRQAWRWIVLICLLANHFLSVKAADRAINFDTGGGPVEVPNFQLAGVSDEVTVEFWANVTHPYDQPVFALEPSDNGANVFQGQLAYRNGTTMFQCGTASVSADPSTLPTTMMRNWNHFAFVASATGNYLRIYINGELLAETTVGTHTLFNPALGNYTLRIGGKDPWERFTGHIDDFRIWNVARTQEQIYGHMISYPQGNEPGLRLYYKFDEDDPQYHNEAKAVNSATATGAAFHGTIPYRPGYIQSWATPALSRYVVNTTADTRDSDTSGSISLRYATSESSSGGPTLITFDPALNGQTVSLSRGAQLYLAGRHGYERISIDASHLPAGLTIAGGPDTSRLFNIRQETIATIKGLTLTGGGGTYSSSYNSRSQDGHGGAIYCEQDSELTLINCTLTGNTAYHKGGAIFIEAGGTLQMQGCTLSTNTAYRGGAIFNRGTLTMKQCTLAGNDADNGGAMESESNTTLIHCTISNNNTSRWGTTITQSISTLTLAHCIIAGNFAKDLFDDDDESVAGVDLDTYNSGSVIQVGTNLIGSIANESGTITGPAALTADPQLRPLADNGGPTKTMALLASSPALDAAAGSTTTTDQRGLPIVGVPDLGAFEVQASTVFVTSSDDSAVFGQSLTFTAAVTGFIGETASGTMIFTLDGTPSSPVPLNANGAATLTTSTLSVGPHTITATYSGDVNLPPSTLIQTVAQASTSVAVSSNLNPSVVSQTVTFTATVVPLAPGAGTATGTVDFFNEDTLLGTASLDGRGVATFSINALDVASHDITASYSGDSSFADSTSKALTQTVNKSDTTMALGANANPSTVGMNVTFTAKVAAVIPGAGMPAGTVTFHEGVQTLGTALLNANGVATFSTSKLSVGSHSVTATYSGDVNLSPHTSDALTQTVNTVNTVVALNSSNNPSTVGMNVTFTAKVAAVIPSAGTPTGSVIFSIDGKPQPISALSDGVASFTTNALGVGTHNVTASYEGGGDFNASESIPLVETINGPVTLSGTLPRGYVGTAYSQSLTASGGTGAKTLEVTSFISGGTGLTAPSISADTATLSGTLTGPGTLSFNLKATDELGAFITQSYSLTVVNLVVTTTSPTGPGSLTEVLGYAAALPGPDTITFNINPTHAILIVRPIVIDSDVTLDGVSRRGGVKIVSDFGRSRLFEVNNGISASFVGFQFIGGFGNVRDGGAIHNNGTLALTDCTLSANNARNGGAIYNNGALTLTNCVLSGNSAGSGGGIFSEAGSTVTMDRCTLRDNSATNGGGLRVKGRLTMTQCLLVSNSGHTAATLLADTGSDVSLVHCTAASGYASTLCSGVLARGTLRLQHCVLGQNSGPTSQPVDLLVESGTTTLIGLNLIERITGTVTGPAPIRAKPLLSSGGRPLPGSPAIDQAPVMTPALTTDLFGHPRPLGLRPDVGAIEGPIVVTTPVDELDPPGVPGAGVSLREAVRDTPAGHTIAFDRAVFTALTTLTLTKGPLNPERNCTLDNSGGTGVVRIVHVPTITKQPASLSVESGAAASFAVSVENTSGGISYAWRKNGKANGIKTSAMHILSAQENDEAAYDVVLGEAAQRGVLGLIAVEIDSFHAISKPASLIVDDAAVKVLTGPVSAMLALGSNHTLSVVAIGPASPAPALKYQWYRMWGEKVSGATESSYTITNAQFPHAGHYKCVVTSGVTRAESGTAEIGVVDTRPRTVNAPLGGSFTAAVSAAGDDLSYTWTLNGTPLPTVANSFVIKPVAWADAGLYTCTVTGSAGQLANGCNINLNIVTAATGVPSIISYPLPQAYIGQPYSWQVPVENFPGLEATMFNIRGLPPGLTYSAATGIISGRPTASKPGGYAVTIRAANAKGYAVADKQTLIVNVLPQGSLGTFAGPMARSSLNDQLGGRFDLTTTAAGTFSGSITLGAREKIGFIAKLLHSTGAGDMIFSGSIPGIAMADKTPLNAYVEVFATEQYARLTLAHPNGTTLVTDAWRKPWVLSKTLALNMPATDYAAYYTARLDAGQGGYVSPDGYGYTSFTISPSGILTLAGKLPDGSAITGGTHVGPNGEVLLFNLLYGTRGSQVGRFDIAKGTPATNNTLTGTTTWLKPAPLIATSTDTIYRAGFGPLNVDAQGGVYVAPTAGNLVMSLPAVPNHQSNAKVSFSEGGIAAPNSFHQSLRFFTKTPQDSVSLVGLLPPFNNSAKLTAIDSPNGSFSGSFIVYDATTAQSRSAPFVGQIVKIGATTEGYGYFLLPKIPVPPETVTTAPKLSGRVVLGVP